MKFKNIFFFFLIITSYLSAQVGINTDNPKATLDVNLGDINQINPNIPPGFIAPVFTLSQLNNIAGNYHQEQIGTIVYISTINTENKDETLSKVTTIGYYYFDGSSWNQFITPSSGEIPTEPWLNALTGEGATSNSENISHNAQIGIGFDAFNTAIDPNAQLEITSTSKGLIIPRLTKVQRDAIQNPTVSMLIWNTDEKCFNFYKDDVIKWRSLCGDLGDAEIQINDCSSVKVNGVYTIGVPLDPSHTLQLTVNVTKPGNYSISGTTDVGIFFQKSGVFPSTGVYTIILPGYGAPSTAGDNIPVTIAINDYQNTSCDAIKITEIKTIELKYSVLSQEDVDLEANKLIIGESSNGKKIKLNVDIQKPGFYTIQTNEVEGIKYGLYSTELTTGIQVITLYSNGVTMPKYKPNGDKYTASDQLSFTITGTGQTVPFNTATVGLISQEASFTITSITPNTNNNNYFVSGKAVNNNNFIDVKLKFTSKGTYTFRAFNSDANVEYLLKGNYTGNLNSDQNFRIFATSTLTPNKVNDYIYTAVINDIASTTPNFNVSVIYPKPKIIIYGWGYANSMLDALQENKNFGPQGTLKVESMKNSSKNYNENINQFGGEQFTYANLYDAINNQNAKIILVTWDIINSNATLTPDIIRLLSEFITVRKGYVFFTNAKDQGNFIKQVLDQTHGTNLSVITNDTYPLKAAELPTTGANATANKYLDGKFGKLFDKYYVTYNNDYSWVGFNTTSLASATSGLNSFINLPDVTYNSVNYPAASSLIYSTKYGFFMLPDKYSLINVNNDTGTYNPISFNTQEGSTNTRILGNNGSLISNGSASILAGKSGDWVLFGNIMAEAIKYTHENYNNTVEVD